MLAVEVSPGAKQVLIAFKTGDSQPPGWTGIFYSNFPGAAAGVKYWVVNVTDPGQLNDWLMNTGKTGKDLIYTGSGTAAGSVATAAGNNFDFFDFDNPDFQVALTTLLILIALGILTGATFIELLYTALIVAALYTIYESVEMIKSFFDGLIDTILPKSVKDWLDQNFPGGGGGFKNMLLAGILTFAGYKTVKHFRGKKK